MTQSSITTAYDLPFEVRCSRAPLLSSGGAVRVIVESEPESDSKILATVLEHFGALSATGALAGEDIEPWNSGVQIGTPGDGTGFELLNCHMDEQALIVLTHLLLARQEELLIRSVEVSLRGRPATRKLPTDSTSLSWYPDCYRSLPFKLIDEDPESVNYTFVIELREPLQASHGEYLEHALKRWTEAILAGGYGLAPIPPQESYVEPDDDCVTSFDTTVEWTIFKLRANPDCIQGLINIFAAFHHRCQNILSVTIM